VEYQDKRDPAIDVGFPFAEPERLAKAFGLASLPAQQGYVVIWTTTPWTIPSNQALNMHPEFIYALYKLCKRMKRYCSSLPRIWWKAASLATALRAK